MQAQLGRCVPFVRLASLCTSLGLRCWLVRCMAVLSSDCSLGWSNEIFDPSCDVCLRTISGRSGGGAAAPELRCRKVISPASFNRTTVFFSESIVRILFLRCWWSASCAAVLTAFEEWAGVDDFSRVRGWSASFRSCSLDSKLSLA